ncbi:hypothetical protein BpHYR1_018753 [Brachionus plicatilis]|uniref:Uncharacterized protein n=1 Tax=Brachionus plicatilis TaxID=10195 RepID=A0A3M7QPP4_BRAPC|nr:hypothetical protein BpHYR1_018753 [Brachionus plicatilis]
MGPTDWVSNLVLVPKSTDPLVIRITTDSRAVNNAVKRTRFPGKTIEDITYLVNGAKFFSKIDYVFLARYNFDISVRYNYRDHSSQENLNSTSRRFRYNPDILNDEN